MGKFGASGMENDQSYNRKTGLKKHTKMTAAYYIFQVTYYMFTC